MAPLGLDSSRMKVIIFKARMEHKYFIYSSGIPLFFGIIEAIIRVVLLPVVSRVIKAEVLYALAHRKCNLFCWLSCIDLTKDVCQVGRWVGGPTQDDFPGLIYPWISERSFSSSFLSMENNAEQKGRWHAQWKAKDNKQYDLPGFIGFNVVAIWAWKLISS